MRKSQKGFTLIELMVVVVIIGILASIGLPFYNNYILTGNVNQALPYLQTIAAKQRIHYNRTGRYLATTNEQELQQRLGINLADASDFCFISVCYRANGCGDYGGAGGTLQTATPTGAVHLPVDTGNPAGYSADFQIFAGLRSAAATDTFAIAGGTFNCSVGTDPQKRTASGWVSTAAAAGGVGRLVALTYPPPASGFTTTQYNGRVIEWQNGLSITDAVLD